VIGALMAMHHLNQNRGKGQFIDVALYESVFAVMESMVPEFSLFQHVRERTGASLPGISPSNTYRCADDRYVIIAGNGDAIFKRLMQAMNRPDLADDPRLAHNDGRVENNAMLDAAISAWTADHPLDHVLSVLEAADVPAGKIYTAEDIAHDPHYQARHMIERVALDDGTPVDFPGIVPKLSATPGATVTLGPALGQHTDEILASLGYDEAKVASLRARQII
jgi:formyl-CoA transferase